MLDNLFGPVPQGQPLLAELRADLAAKFPELDAQKMLERARADILGRASNVDLDRPPIHLREVGPPGPEGGPSEGAVLDSRCLPGESRTDGWFARHAFKVAMVNDEVRKLGAALSLAGTSAGPLPSPLAWATKRLGTFRGGKAKILDCIQRAFVRAMEKAATFKCGEPFEKWFHRILSNTIHDDYREGKTRPKTDDAYEVLWAEPEAPKDEPPVELSPWLKNVLDGFAEHGIEIQSESLELLMKLEPQGSGMKEPSGESLKHAARFVRRYVDEQAQSKGTKRPSDEVPLKFYELYSAYGRHQSFRRELDPKDPVAIVLLEVEKGIEELIEFQEAKDRARSTWPAGAGAAAGPAERLAEIQGKAWGQLARRPDSHPAWKAVNNLHWFSWKLKAAAVLAACLRYARRHADPALGPLVEALRPLESLRTFTEDVREILDGFRPVVLALPIEIHPDSEGIALLMRLALHRACLPAGKPDSIPIDADLPDADLNWWISRVTGEGVHRADKAVRDLAKRAKLLPESLDRS